MSFVKIKICGIRTIGDADACAEAGADYLGFIFYPASPRYIAPEEAAKIVASLPRAITPVGVFVNETPAAIDRAASVSGIRMAQLSGEEPPETGNRIGLPIIKVFRPLPGPLPDRSAWRLFASMVDGSAPGRYGGSGTEPDLDFAERLAATGRLFLAGGLRPGNVAERIGRVRPFAVDVCSGTESRPGVKDRGLVREFCSRVRNATTGETPLC